MNVDLNKADWIDDIKTIEDLAELLSYGWEFHAKYKGIGYHIENEFMGYWIGNDDIGTECQFDTKEEFIEKATIGGDLLKDVIGQVYLSEG